MNEFVHLHLHTEFSLLDGACRIKELLEHAGEAGTKALAVTEHGNLFSSVAFHDEARKQGVKPILGCEVYVAPGDRTDRSGSRADSNNHLVLLAENLTGYHNLIKLVSAGYTEGFYHKPRIDKSLLETHREGLIGLSACLKGEVATGLRTDRPSAAAAAAGRYREILGPGSFFLEMQYQGIPEQRVVNTGLLALSRDLDIPLVCTNDVHYLKQEDHHPHDVLLCIGTGKNIDDEKRLRYHGDRFYLKTPDEMAAVFGSFPDAMKNTVAIADRCDVELAEGRSHLPDFEVPEPYTVDGYFEHVAREGFKERREDLRRRTDRKELKHSIAEYEERFRYEIRVITEMKYPGYFLIVWDFIRHAREKGIPVGPGRGSAAGSLVAWCMGITDVDPMPFGLIFERFLNPERVSLPDIDIDFCENRRNEVIDYVTRKYGRDNVAQIITFGTLKARAVVRDVGRTMGMSYAEVDRVAKQVPPALNMTLDRALKESPALKALADESTQVGELIAVGRRLEGITRHASVHAAGVVITPRAVTDFAPVYKSQKDEITTQWAMKQVERMGLLKMDFLGLSTLTLIENALAQIKRTTGAEVDPAALALNDAATYRLFQRGDTRGVFQFESGGMREILKRAKPRRFEDLIALNALYRPGPLQGGVVNKYIDRKHGREKIEYDYPALEPILAETYGVIAYQEQVMRIAGDLAGFTMGEADLLRKAMGKKDPAVMQAQQERFVTGATDRGMPREKADTIFNFIRHFAGYGFNKSHSTAYALLAYQTAWLKTHYPVHFMAALLTIEAQNTDKLTAYLAECRDNGVAVLPPDINRSGLGFEVDGDAIRFGLAAVKNMGQAGLEAILAHRREHERVRSLYTLCEEIDTRQVNRRVMENLIKAGAFDHIGKPVKAGGAGPGRRRAQMTAIVERALEHGARMQRDRERGQTHLFGTSGDGNGNGNGADDHLPDIPGWSDAETLQYEKEALGLYLTGHPMDGFRRRLKAMNAGTIDAVESRKETVTVGGMIGALNVRTTKKGDKMATAVLEDRTGRIEIIVFPQAYRATAKTLESETGVLVTGRPEQDEDRIRLVVDHVARIDHLTERHDRTVRIRLGADHQDRETFQALAEIMKMHRGPSPVEIQLGLESRTPPLRVTAALGKIRVRASEALFQQIETLCGPGAAAWS